MPIYQIEGNAESAIMNDAYGSTGFPRIHQSGHVTASIQCLIDWSRSGRSMPYSFYVKAQAFLFFIPRLTISTSMLYVLVCLLNCRANE